MQEESNKFYVLQKIMCDTLVSFVESKEKSFTDLLFILGSTGDDAVMWFEKEKQIAQQMIENNREKDISYAVMVYGKNLSIKSKFNETTSEENLKMLINNLTWEGKGIKMGHALKAAIKLFRYRDRPNSRKMVVVFISGHLDEVPRDLKKLSGRLHDDDVKIVVLKLGNHTNDEQLEVITPRKNIVTINENETNEHAAEKVDDEIMQGKKIIHVFQNDFLFHSKKITSYF